MKVYKKEEKSINNCYSDYCNNFNLSEYDELKEYKALNKYIEDSYAECKENFVLIDEIQMCNNFELCINNLHATEMYDIYITGSNAFLLSSDLATLFTGRTFEIKVYPFSFAEYVEYFNPTDKYTAFDNYMFEGGMSGSYLYKEQEDKYDYKEIDFVALKRNEKIYIQVSDNITLPETFKREVDPLFRIKDAYPKMVIVRTWNPEYQYEGVKIVDVAEWLLNK